MEPVARIMPHNLFEGSWVIFMPIGHPISQIPAKHNKSQSILYKLNVVFECLQITEKVIQEGESVFA
jgi:hypothetical protein